MRRTALLVVAALAASCGGAKEPDEVRVFAASSLTEVMQTIAADFEKETGVKVKLNLAASSTLAKQIVEGAPCDVFLSADEEWADYVEKAGLVEPGTRRDLLTNDLVIVFPSERPVLPVMELDPTDPDPTKKWELARRARIRAQLTHPHVRTIAMGDPAHVPAGKYAKQALEQWGVWKEIEGKIIACDSTRSALALVERSESDAGIVYVTDQMASRSVVGWTWMFDGILDAECVDGVVINLPKRIRNPKNPIRYPAMRVRGSTPLAERFEMHLQSPDARKAFEAAGFGIAGKAE